MRKKSLTLAIVIPVYNEERHLKDCLDSIAQQTIKPDEVIVVDNNSTDKSMAIARRYNFVKILREKKQHQVFAQTTGFNAARSDILGRVDGDSILPKDWVRQIKDAYTGQDELVAITGSPLPYDVSLQKFGMALFDFYMFAAGLIAGHRLLWGANCAILAKTWQNVKKEILMRADIWEDFDLSFCLAEYGKIKHLPNLKVGVSARNFHNNLIKQIRYQFRAVRTFYLRTGYLKTGLLFLLWTTQILFFPLAMLDSLLLKVQRRKTIDSI
jgi:glycosyltransferase involved in cell wall biosynthesis